MGASKSQPIQNRTETNKARVVSDLLDSPNSKRKRDPNSLKSLIPAVDIKKPVIFTQMQVALLWLVTVILMLTSFIVGMRVGEGKLDSRVLIAQQAPAMIAREKPSALFQAAVATNYVALPSRQLLQSPNLKPIPAGQTTAKVEKKKVVAAAIPKPIEKQEPVKPAPAVTEVRQIEAPKPQLAAPEIKPAVSAAVTEQNWYVLFSTKRTKEEANTLHDNLKSVGYSSTLRPAEDRGSDNGFQVLVGPFLDKELAEEQQRRLGGTLVSE